MCALSEPDRSCNQKHTGTDGEGSDGSLDAVPGRREAFGGDGCGHDGHRAQVHHADD